MDWIFKIVLRDNGKYGVMRYVFAEADEYREFDVLKGADGEELHFNEREDARAFLNKVIKPEFIEGEDRIANNEQCYRLPIEEWE